MAEFDQQYRFWDDGWTVEMLDGGWTAQFEHTMALTEKGLEVLTLPE